MTGPAGRLFAALGSGAYLFTLTPADLGLTEAHALPSALYCPQSMGHWRTAVASAFAGPVFYALEVGKGRGHLHVHVIAHRADGPQLIRRGSERCKPIYNPQCLLEYLHKPAEPWSLAAEADYRASKVLSPQGRAPQTRGKKMDSKRMAWAEANALSASFAENAQSETVVPLAWQAQTPRTQHSLSISEAVGLWLASDLQSPQSGMVQPLAGPELQPLLSQLREQWTPPVLPSPYPVQTLAGRPSLRLPLGHSRLWAEAALAPPRPLA
jgi:hypothetical protein